MSRFTSRQHKLSQCLQALICMTALLFSLISLSVLAQPGAATIIPQPPAVNASSYLLMDAVTGHVIIEHNADEALPPASLTKIMTDYVAASELESGNITLDDNVFVSVKAWRMEGSKMFIQEGTSVRLEDILRGIIIQSGNDAAVALAEHAAGSEDAFADMMNQHAQRLGMTNSHFTNASGLPDENHYMSARDLAILARALITEYPDNYAMYSEREFTYNDIRQPNRNTLLFRDSNVDGMKTGYTEEAGYCLVASAMRDGMRLISVVMGTDSTSARATESQKLLTYGFRFYETTSLFQPGEVLASEKIWSGKSNSVALGVADGVVITVPKGQRDQMETVLEVPDIIKAPLEVGQPVGIVRISLGEELIHEGPVVALEAVEKGGIFKRLMDWFYLLILGLFD